MRLWVEKGNQRYTIIPYQLVVDDIAYVDFVKHSSARPNYFWIVVGALIFGMALILIPAIRNMLLRK